MSTEQVAVRPTDRTVRLLRALAGPIAGPPDERAYLRTSLEAVMSALEIERGATFLRTPGGMEPAAGPCADGERWPGGEEAARTAAETGEPCVSVDGEGWTAAAPLRAGERLLGALALHGTSAAPDRPLLDALGRQVGAGLENVRCLAELLASAARSETVQRITATLSAGVDVKAAMPAFAREMAALATFDRLACGFVNDSGDYIEVATHPEDGGWGFGGVLPVVGSGPGAVVLNSRAIVQPDLLHAHRYIEDLKLLEDGIRSYALLPLVSRGRGIGVLALGGRERHAFDEEQVARLQPIVDSVALALENMRLVHKMREMSITDEVTPLFNFRFFHQILDRELKLVDRYKSVLSLVFIDLDKFKPINDQYGHLRGSRVLREVGFLLRAAVRETDYPARYGGDEFTIILPQTDGAAARVLADKLKRLITNHTFLQEEGIDARIGASFGVATYPTEATTKEALVRLADERMYAAKTVR